MSVCVCACVTVRENISHLVLFKVTYSLDYDGAAALLLRVARFQPDDGLGLVDQTVDLPLIFHNSLLLFLWNRKRHRNTIFDLNWFNVHCKLFAGKKTEYRGTSRVFRRSVRLSMGVFLSQVNLLRIVSSSFFSFE